MDRNLRPTFKSGRTTVGAWSCFCGDEIGPLYVTDPFWTVTVDITLDPLWAVSMGS
jgi:hypothetical protein